MSPYSGTTATASTSIRNSSHPSPLRRESGRRFAIAPKTRPFQGRLKLRPAESLPSAEQPKRNNSVKNKNGIMAERVGFEPTVEFPLHSLSRRALSTAQTPLRGRFVIVADAWVAQQRSACKPATASTSGWTQHARETLVRHCIYQDGPTATRGFHGLLSVSTAGCEKGLEKQGAVGCQDARYDLDLMV